VTRYILSDSSGCLSELHLDAASLRLLVVLRARASVDTLIGYSVLAESRAF